MQTATQIADADAVADRRYEEDEVLAASLVGTVVFYDRTDRGIVDEVEAALGGVYVSGRMLDSDGKPIDGDTWEARVGDVRIDEDVLAVEADRMLAFLLGKMLSAVSAPERTAIRFVNRLSMKPAERAAFDAGLAGAELR